MLATIILVLCVAASAVAGGILFVLFGPVPTRRRVTLVARIQAPLPMAAGPIAMPGASVFDPAMASFTPTRPFAAAPPPDLFGAAAVEVPPPPRPARKKPLPPIAPVQLRRPRTAPAPLTRTRSARGTEPRNTSFDVEHTAPDAPMFEVDDPTFLEDGH